MIKGNTQQLRLARYFDRIKTISNTLTFAYTGRNNRRQISDEKKIAIFAKKQKCELCGFEFKDYKEAEYHHKIRYVDGGKTEIGNIMILCSKWHDELHGNSVIPLSKKNHNQVITNHLK